MPDVPLPDQSVWAAFPEIAVVVLVVIIFAIGIYAFTRWVWGEYKCERDKDRAWREEQGKQRDVALASLNQAWKESVEGIAERWQEHIKKSEDQERLAADTLKAAVEAINRILTRLEEHDQRAAKIGKEVAQIKRRIGGPPLDDA